MMTNQTPTGSSQFVSTLVWRRQMSLSAESLPQMRFDITEAARILRMSRATLYERIRLGELKPQKDGRRSYVTATELQRYISSKG